MRFVWCLNRARLEMLWFKLHKQVEARQEVEVGQGGTAWRLT